jgi:VCBS repeat-containing protein
MADRLEVIRPDGQIVFYTLDAEKGITNIGQHPDNDIIVDSPHLGPFQAVLDHQRRPYRIIVLSEDGGARLEGHQLPPNTFKELHDWQTVELDGYTLTLLEDHGNGSTRPVLSQPVIWQTAALASTPVATVEPVLATVEAPVRPGPPPAPPAHEYPARPTDEVDDYVLAELSLNEITVNVEETGIIELTLTNGGPKVANFDIWVEGIDSEWVNVYPSRVDLYEEARTTVAIEIHAEKKHTSTAGTHHFAVHVRSRTYEGRRTVLGASVTINPYYEFTAAGLTPSRQKTSWFKRSAYTQFPITNKGNSLAHYLVSGQDDENGCQFEFHVGEEAAQVRQAEIVIPAGETATVPITLTPLRRRLVSMRSHHYNYAITTKGLDESSVARTYSGQVASRPLFGLLSVLLFLAALAALFVIIFQPRYSGALAAGQTEILIGSPIVLRWDKAPFYTSARIVSYNEQISRSQQVAEFVPLNTGRYEFQLVASNFLSDLLPFINEASSNKVFVTVKPPLPAITSFTVSSTEILQGENVVVRWAVENASSVVLTFNGIPEQLTSASGGEVTKILTEDTVIKLEAENAAGEKSEPQQVIVVVYPPQINIEVFKVTPDVIALGEEITVEWKVTGSGIQEMIVTPYPGKVEIDGTGIYTDKRTFKPKENLEFVITVKSRNEVKSELVPIIVGPAKSAPTIDYFRVSPNELAANDSKTVTFAWSVSGEVDTIRISNPEGFDSGNLLSREDLGKAIKQNSLKTDVPRTSVFILTASNGGMVATEVVEVKVQESKKDVEIEILKVFPSTSFKRGTEIIVAYRVRPLVNGTPVDNPAEFGLPEVSGKVVVTEGLEQCSSELPITTCTFKPQVRGKLTATYFGDDVYARRTTEFPTVLDISGEDVDIDSITVDGATNAYVGAVSNLKIVLKPSSPLAALPINGQIDVYETVGGINQNLCEKVVLVRSTGSLNAEGICTTIFNTRESRKFLVVFSGDENQIYNSANLSYDKEIIILQSDTRVDITSVPSGTYPVGQPVTLEYLIRNSRNSSTGPALGTVTLETDNQGAELGVCPPFNPLTGRGSCSLTFTMKGSGQRLITLSYVPPDSTYDYKGGTTSAVLAVSNLPPQAEANFYTTDEDALLSPSVLEGVLSNDLDPEGLPLTAELITQPVSSTIVLAADGTFSYDPTTVFNHLAVGESGSYSFIYRIFDGEFYSEPAEVVITITGVNDAPFRATNPFPEDGAPGRSIRTTLRWEGSDPDTSDFASLSYNVLIWEEGSPDPLVNAFTAQAVYTPTALLMPEKTYTWQVDTYDLYDFMEGPLWTFTTLPPPGPFNKVYHGDDPILSNQVTLEWTDSYGATEYQFCVSDVSPYDFPNPGVNHPCETVSTWITVTAATTSADVLNLEYDTLYFWQARAVSTDTVVMYAEADAMDTDDPAYWFEFKTYPAPGPFEKMEPPPGSPDLRLPLEFLWTASEYADRYEICVKPGSAGGDCTWIDAGSALSISLDEDDELYYSQGYYWQVRAVNVVTNTEADGEVWWSFATLFPPQQWSFVKILPQNGITGLITTTQTLSWTTTAGADSYEYCYYPTALSGCDDESDWTSDGAVISGGTVSVTLTNLDFGTNYTWQARAVNPAGKIYADANTPWTFETLYKPAAFEKVAPANGVTGLITTTVTLEWNPTARANSYEYCYGIGGCTGGWIPVTLIQGSDTISVTLTGLSFETTYTWQVRAENEAGYTYANGENGEWTFSTQDRPGAFGKVTPSAGQAGLGETLTLTWLASLRAEYYEYCYQLHSSGACSNGNNWIRADGLSVQISGLSLLKTYQWQVRAVNVVTSTDADEGAFWTYYTMDSPAAFAKVSPPDNELSVPITTTLTWQASTDVDYYQYCLQTAEADCSASSSNWSTPVVTTSVEVRNLAFNTTYYWDVRAVNGYATTYASGGIFDFTTASFTKTFPTNGSGDHPTTLTLQWAGNIGAKHYDYCLRTDAAVCPDTGWVKVTNASQVTLTLNPATVYYWQVRTKIVSTQVYANDGEWWTFRTAGPPGAFGKTSPENNVITASTSITLTWGTSAWATTYQYCYSFTMSCTTWSDPVTGTSAQVSGLSPGTTYHWQVRAWAGAHPIPTYANSGTWWTFRTPGPPEAFNKNAPQNGAVVDVPPVIEWDGSLWADSYKLCYYPHGGSCTTWVTILTVPEVLTSTPVPTYTHAITGLVEGTTYWWQLRAYQGGTHYKSANGGEWSFTTAGFSKLAPANGTIDQPLDDLELSWASLAEADGYQYCYSTGTSCATWVPITPTLSLTATLSGLQAATNYTWQVRAVLGGNADPVRANSGTFWTFRTAGPPGAFDKTSPQNNASTASTSSDLTWEMSARATGYEYCVSLTPSCDTWSEPVTGTSASVSGLTPGTTYHWQVRARAGTHPELTYANSGTWWAFATAEPPQAFRKLPLLGSSLSQPLSLTFAWESSPQAEGYEFCLTTSPEEGCAGGWIPVQGTSMSLNGLQPSTTYSWQVRAFSASYQTEADGENAWASFTTQGPPGAFSRIGPNDSSGHKPLDVSLAWESSPRAERYEYCLQHENDGTCSGGWISTQETAVFLSGLEPNTTYYWQVRAVAGKYTVLASGPDWSSFTTGGPPGEFSQSTPLDGGLEQPLSLTLTWEASPRADSYLVCFDAVLDSSCQAEWISVPDTRLDLSGLAYNTTYEWQVRAVSGEYFLEGLSSARWWTFSTQDPLSSFTRLEPADGSSNLLESVVLSWEIAAGAEQYEYCISSSPADGCPTGWVLTTGTSAELHSLSYKTTYFWQVRAVIGGYSKAAEDSPAWWSFTTEDPLGAFSKQSPSPGSMPLPVNLSLSWEAIPRADRYEVCFNPVPVSGCTTRWITTQEPYLDLFNLGTNITYYWQVRAYSGSYFIEADQGGPWWSFTTAGPPGAFSRIYPENEIRDRAVEIQLYWEPALRAEYYEVCLDTTPDFICSTEWMPVRDTVLDISGLDYSTTYYWQVRAYAGEYLRYSASEYDWGSFTTGSPLTPFRKLEPLTTSQAQPLDLTLWWEGVPLADRYEYCLNTLPVPQCSTGWVSTQDSFAALSGLKPNTTYFWQVRAYAGTHFIEADRYDYQERGLEAWWTFTTGGPPDPFGKMMPFNRSTEQPLALQLSWSKSPRAEYYALCVDTTPDQECDGGWEIVSGISFDLSGLASSTTYYWQVRAYLGEHSLEANGKDLWWSFTTAPEGPPAAFSKLSASPVFANGQIVYQLTWQSSRREDRYEYCIEPQLTKTCESGWIETSGTSVRISGLTPGVTYYWQVRAFSGAHSVEANLHTWWPLTVLDFSPAPAVTPAPTPEPGSRSP